MYYFPTSTLFVSFAIGIFYWLQQVAFNNFHSYFCCSLCYGFLLLLFAGCLFRVHFPFTCKISHSKFTENISPLPLSELGFLPLSFSRFCLRLLFLPQFVAQLCEPCIFSHFSKPGLNGRAGIKYAWHAKKAVCSEPTGKRTGSTERNERGRTAGTQKKIV